MERLKNYNGISRVSLVRCDGYNPDDVYLAIKRGIDLIGGIEQFVTAGEKILLKPNILAAREPDRVTTTHPAVFEGVVRILKNINVDIYFGESPAYDNPLSAAKKSGILGVAEKYGVKYADFDKGRNINFPDGIFEKDFIIAEGVFQTDGIISIPKMKSHQLTRITGAVKNQFGCVVGFNKAKYHVKIPNGDNFCKMLVDLNNFLKPRLFVMDGIVAMEGNGPSSGNPVNMNVIIVSNDPVALDSTFCKLIDLNPEFISTNTYGREYNLGTYIEGEIQYFGCDIRNFINKKFDVERKPVKTKTTFEKLIFIEPYVARKPVIDKSLCVKCGICVEECPVEGKALEFLNSRKNPPIYDYKKCIRCYCCQEVCPHHAISVKTPILGKILGI